MKSERALWHKWLACTLASFVFASCLVGCEHGLGNQRVAASLAECLSQQTCTVTGPFRVSSDGHGYVGILELPDGCLNVSIPEGKAKALFLRPPEVRTFRGRLFPYSVGDTVFEHRINGRKIGMGLCGESFLFVN